MKKQLFLLLSFCSAITLTAQQITINGPVGSNQFGSTVTVLTNGNYVITDPQFSESGKNLIGAVYLYNGSTHSLISTLKGNTSGDLVGSAGIVELTNGNFVVHSPFWNNGSVIDAGAVTWCHGTTGITGVVSISNSLVGSSVLDFVGTIGVTALPNGNYVVNTRDWNNGPVADAGAVTWCNGNGGTVGVINSSNSLVGSSFSDQVGGTSITVLPNGNYVVSSPEWDNGAISSVGAVTWCNGLTGRSGVLSSSNSLVGTTPFDRVGSGSIYVLSNGNYLVSSPTWSNGGISLAGAVTWASGITGITGIVSSSNSLVGGTASDNLGNFGITLLSNDNYVISCPFCDIGGVTDAGAVIWGNGTTGISGQVSSSNSLAGGTASDRVGNVTALTNGNYVVTSLNWDNAGNADAGAVTWGNGGTGTTGLVSASNSLVGSIANDQVGFGGITPLVNGNYVIASPELDNGPTINIGAVTWGDGTTGISGSVSSSNSLVGSRPNDRVGIAGITAFSNGNYVVSSPNWNNGVSISFAGAVTWCNGTTGRTGPVSVDNSLVGGTSNNNVGSSGVTILLNGNYVVNSPNWDNVGANNAGAVTWGNGTTGTTGVVNSSNSLVGTTLNDQVGSGGISPLSNGNYVVSSPNWDNAGFFDIGAVTWGNGTTGTSGVVSSSNSLVGSNFNDRVGSGGIAILTNGNYVVKSTSWDNAGSSDAGAVTWGNGTTGTTGLVSASNSLVGSIANDQVGIGGITPLVNGNYVIASPDWDNGAIINTGAVTWCDGATGRKGAVSASNSLVGSTASDQVGTITALSNSNFLVLSPIWDNGVVTDVGAATWGNGSTLLSGTINSCNSVSGSVTGSINSTFNGIYGYLLVGVPASNRVVIYNPIGQALANHLDVVSTSINGSNEVPFVTNPSCRIIGTLKPNGASPVSGTVNAQAWIESSVPSFGGQPFVARHYEITPATNPSTATGRVTLYFTQQEFTDFNNDPGSLLNLPTGSADAAGKANLRIEKRSGTSSNGTGLPGSYSGINTTIDPADGDIVWNATLNRWEVSFDVTGFSGFFMKTTLTVLPLTLLEFNGRLQNGNALLNWKTENELNTDQFVVERSIDGRNFAVVGTVDARNQPGTNQYNHIDAGVNRLGASMVYYRLKQTDIDSRFTYSRIIALPLGRQNNLMLYPNPATDQLIITLSAERAEKVQVRIIDNAGRVLRQQEWNSTAGSVTMQLEVSSLAKGMYYLEVKGETTDQRKIFVKL